MGVMGSGGSALDYDFCRYGESRVRFRGPARDLDGDYVAFAGGTDTFGLFVPVPFPDLIEEEIGLACVNLGVVNAGPGLFLNDPAARASVREAKATVLQMMGAQNLTNAHYSVHPRRNDRFLRASDALVSLFPEIDFTEFHYTRHMLSALEYVSPHRFRMVLHDLRSTWEQHMTRLIAAAGGPVILLRFATGESPGETDDALARDPGLVDGPMVARLAQKAFALVDVEDLRDRDTTWGKVHRAHEVAAARECLGPEAHERAAEALVGPLRAALAR
ncbi:hypothetical protein SAMN05444340_10460 [Citreimonas salinaria]|uniref:DUF6473 domain-containing protein n=2 Tax=Citreimonas salinaria TaxID=321339 RepID=A0A1H3HNW2_9RHOB|nr:hypothetical protein SAMN05444340_10460 [Citreimonas salinaria]